MFGSPSNGRIGIPFVEALKLLKVHELSELVHRANAPHPALFYARDLNNPQRWRSPVRSPLAHNALSGGHNLKDICQVPIVELPIWTSL